MVAPEAAAAVSLKKQNRTKYRQTNNNDAIILSEVTQEWKTLYALTHKWELNSKDAKA